MNLTISEQTMRLLTQRVLLALCAAALLCGSVLTAATSMVAQPPTSSTAIQAAQDLRPGQVKTAQVVEIPVQTVAIDPQGREGRDLLWYRCCARL